MDSGTYVIYNSPESVGSLDVNGVDPRYTIEMPNHIYDGEAFPLSQYMCESGPRDTSTNYLYPTEQTSHPDHFSRFAYPYCWNGYCSGHWNGRYNTPPMYWPTTDAQPRGLAPKRFYTEPKYTSPYYSDSPAYRDSRIARQLR